MGLSQNFKKVLSLDHPAASMMVFMGVLPELLLGWKQLGYYEHQKSLCWYQLYLRYSSLTNLWCLNLQV